MINQLCKDIDTLTTELIATKSQLSSKCEAIKILSQRLEESLAQTDQFKLMTDQLQERYKTLKRALGTDTSFADSLENSQKNVFLQLKVKVHESEVANRILESEVITLRRRVAELSEDLHMFRKNSTKLQDTSAMGDAAKNRLNDVWERESLVSQLEEKSLECFRLKRDLQLCHDEKNDLFAELQMYTKDVSVQPTSTSLSSTSVPLFDNESKEKNGKILSEMPAEHRCADDVGVPIATPSASIPNSCQGSIQIIQQVTETYDNGPDVFDDSEHVSAS